MLRRHITMTPGQSGGSVGRRPWPGSPPRPAEDWSPDCARRPVTTARWITFMTPAERYTNLLGRAKGALMKNEQMISMTETGGLGTGGFCALPARLEPLAGQALH